MKGMPVPHGRLAILLLAGFLSLVMGSAAYGAVYYIGAFTGSTPRDDADCGTGKGSHPAGHPCATLYYWEKNRNSTLLPNDTVRLAPGTYGTNPADAANGGTKLNCFILDGKAKHVTYEGRSAADTAISDTTSVIVDQTGADTTDNYEGTNPCQGSLVTSKLSGLSSWSSARDYSGVTIRNMRLANAQSKGGLGYFAVILRGPNPVSQGNIPTGITFDHVRITGAANVGGMMLGRFDNRYSNADNDCADGGRDVRDVTIVDSEIDNNKGFPGGVTFACVDGVLMQRSSVHDNCTNCSACTAGASGCDDLDGIAGSGGINVVLQDNEVYHVGEDGIDIGGHPAGKSHHWTIERNIVHDCPAGANLKNSGGRYTLWRNNFIYGTGGGYAAYSCAHHVDFINNTFYMAGNVLQWYTYITHARVINNIFSGANASGSANIIELDTASTNPSNAWRNNIVVNRTGTNGPQSISGNEQYIPNCDGWDPGHTTYTEAYDCSLGYNPPPVPCPNATNSPGLLAASASGLATFRTKGSSGQWFGMGTGTGDHWGVSPTVVNASSPSAPNLHLAASDTLAVNAGYDYSSVGTCSGGRCSDGAYGLPCSTDADCRTTQDFDQNSRPQGAAWDIGADERLGGASAPLAAPTLVSIIPVP